MPAFAAVAICTVARGQIRICQSGFFPRTKPFQARSPVRKPKLSQHPSAMNCCCGAEEEAFALSREFVLASSFRVAGLGGGSSSVTSGHLRAWRTGIRGAGAASSACRGLPKQRSGEVLQLHESGSQELGRWRAEFQRHDRGPGGLSPDLGVGLRTLQATREAGLVLDDLDPRGKMTKNCESPSPRPRMVLSRSGHRQHS